MILTKTRLRNAFYGSMLVSGLAVLAATIPQIAVAYSTNLMEPPESDVQSFTESVAPVMSAPETGNAFIAPKTKTVTMPPAPNHLSEVFLSKMLKSASDDKQLLLWSMYPASVRGRVFSRGNQMASGGW